MVDAKRLMKKLFKRYDCSRNALQNEISRLKNSPKRIMTKEPLQIGGNNYTILLLLEKFGKTKVSFIDKKMEYNGNGIYFKQLLADGFITRIVEEEGNRKVAFYEITPLGIKLLEVIRGVLENNQDNFMRIVKIISSEFISHNMKA